jgi:hypothetical protein
MPFDTATITYHQWREINRTLAGVSLELSGLRHNETLMESKTRRKKEIVNAQAILSDIYRSTEEK